MRPPRFEPFEWQPGAVISIPRWLETHLDVTLSPWQRMIVAQSIERRIAMTNPHRAPRPSETRRTMTPHGHITIEDFERANAETLAAWDAAVAELAGNLGQSSRPDELAGVFAGLIPVPASTLRGILANLMIRDAERLKVAGQ